MSTEGLILMDIQGSDGPRLVARPSFGTVFKWQGIKSNSYWDDKVNIYDIHAKRSHSLHDKIF